MVHTQPLEGTTTQLVVNEWAPGLYHLHVSDATRWISGAKLVVE